MNDVINVAIAGFGFSSRVFHTPFLQNDPRFRVKKVYERRTDNALECLPNVEIVRDFNQLLTDEIDLLIITTPNQTHYDMAKAALSAKKHVLVEKPLAITRLQAEELGSLAKQQGVLLTVYQNRRWDNAIVTAKQILAQHLLGEPVDCEIRYERYAKEKNAKAWKETGEKGTGLVYDLGVHLLDQAVYLFGKPTEIFADIRYQHEGAVSDDNFTIHLYYPSGLKVALYASKYVREKGRHFVLHGKSGSYVKEKFDPQEALLMQGVAPQGNWNAEPETDWGILHTEINGEVIRRPYANVPASYCDFYHNLYAALTKREAPAVTAEQAAVVLGLIEKVFESAQKGCKLKV